MRVMLGITIPLLLNPICPTKHVRRLHHSPSFCLHPTNSKGLFDLSGRPRIKRALARLHTIMRRQRVRVFRAEEPARGAREYGEIPQYRLCKREERLAVWRVSGREEVKLERGAEELRLVVPAHDPA